MSTLIAYDALGRGLNMSNTTNGFGFVLNDPSVSTTYLGAVDDYTVVYQVDGAPPVEYFVFSGTVNLYTYDALIWDMAWANSNVDPLITWEGANIALNLLDDFSVGAFYSILNGNDYIYGNNYSDIIKGGFGNDAIYGKLGNDQLFGEYGNDALNGGAGADTLNGGPDADTMLGGADNDTYIVDNALDKVYETISLSSTTDAGGSDLVKSNVSFTLGSFVEKLTLTGSLAVNGVGNNLANTLVGNAAVNTLNGGSGNDTLSGGSGNDRLIGAAGNDVMTGGVGFDIFRFDKALSATTNVDRISDFIAVYDTIQLENAIFTKLAIPGALAAANYRENTTGLAMDADDYVIYETDTGYLFYDSNGSAAGGQIKIAVLWDSATTHPTASEISYSDFLIT